MLFLKGSMHSEMTDDMESVPDFLKENDTQIRDDLGIYDLHAGVCTTSVTRMVCI